MMLDFINDRKLQRILGEECSETEDPSATLVTAYQYISSGSPLTWYLAMFVKGGEGWCYVGSPH